MTPALEMLWRGSAGPVAVVAPPHPLMGGHLSNPVVQAIASGIVAAGHRAFLFNFRGVGESSGDASADPDEADEDFRSALDIAASAGGPLVAAGYSFGGAAAIRVGCADRRVTAIVAVAPPPALVAGALLGDFAGPLTIIAAELDPIAPAASLSELANGLARVRVETISGADHFFGRGLDRVARIAEGSLRPTSRSPR